jgi:UDP-N-acetylmuramate--alanine ligase
VKEILPQISRPFKTYGFDESADFYAKNIKQTGVQNYFVVHRPNKNPLEITLNLAGEHNVLNALAAIAIATEANIDDQSIQTALKNFGGVGRRLQVYGEYQTDQGTILLVDDYGHHPREITATLSAIRKAWPERRLVMAYQPHRFTRTRDLFNDFAQVLSTADQLLLFDVYSAGESPIDGADSQSLLNFMIKNHKSNPILISPKENFNTILKSILKNNDILLMQGAGDIGSIASNLATTQLQV